MVDKVVSAIERYGMLDNTDTVTVALSGGADSVCLLYVLAYLQPKYGFALSAVHINHCLRGDESDRDEAFVKDLCETLGIPLKVHKVDVLELSKQSSKSIELTARELRYQIFSKIDGVTATAHHAGDNLETVIYNLSRGTGIRGLLGIPPKRDRIIRPLIFCTRDEIEAYLKEKNISFVTDSTNLTDDYTRNVLRHKAVPVLKGINPSVEDRATDMCENLREDADFLDITARKIYILTQKEGYIDAELLKIQHPAIIKRVLALFLAEKGVTADSLHLNLCLETVNHGGRVSMPSGVFVECYGGRFYLTYGNSVEFSVKTEIIDIENTKINNLFLKNLIDCDKICGSVSLRQRKGSDFIRLAGRNCKKSLKKLYNEAKIPHDERENLPVAADDLGVIWVCGIGVDERVKIDGSTKKAMRFNVTNNKEKSGDVK